MLPDFLLIWKNMDHMDTCGCNASAYYSKYYTYSLKCDRLFWHRIILIFFYLIVDKHVLQSSHIFINYTAVFKVT